MFSYKIEFLAAQEQRFVTCSHPQANLLCAQLWAQIKDNWANERLGSRPLAVVYEAAHEKRTKTRCA